MDDFDAVSVYTFDHDRGTPDYVTTFGMKLTGRDWPDIKTTSWILPDGTEVLAVADGEVLEPHKVTINVDGTKTRPRTLDLAVTFGHERLVVTYVGVQSDLTPGNRVSAAEAIGTVCCGETFAIGVIHQWRGDRETIDVDPFGWRGFGEDPLIRKPGSPPAEAIDLFDLPEDEEAKLLGISPNCCREVPPP